MKCPAIMKFLWLYSRIQLGAIWQYGKISHPLMHQTDLSSSSELDPVNTMFIVVFYRVYAWLIAHVYMLIYVYCVVCGCSSTQV